MPAAPGAEVALAGWPAGVGDGVVKVAVLGLGVAAGVVAGGGAGADQVGELAVRRVAGLNSVPACTTKLIIAGIGAGGREPQAGSAGQPLSPISS